MNKGYARVSTTEQNLERQIEALEKAGCEKKNIYQEKITGTHTNRPELQRMLSELEAGDVVIVKELTRVSRSTTDMLKLVNEIAEKGCDIKSLNEGWLDTTSPMGKFLLTVFAGMAQFENELRSQRCSEGRKVAMKKGVQFGRPRTGGKQLDFALELYKSGTMSIRKICENTGVAQATLMRRVKEYKIAEGIEL